MYYSESMIQMVEDLQHQAASMEKEVKNMMELEGRALGLELDKRKSARDMMLELQAHSEAKAEQEAMTWAYVPCTMAQEDPNCYPADDMHVEHVESAPMPEHDEVHYEEAPVDQAPVEAPVGAPVEAPVDAPVDTPIDAPAEAPAVEENMSPLQEAHAEAEAEAPAEPNQPEV